MVVAVGETTFEVPVTEPTPLLIESVGAGAPVTVHDKVVDCPDTIEVGDAVKVVTAGAWPAAGVVADALVDWGETLPAAS